MMELVAVLVGVVVGTLIGWLAGASRTSTRLGLLISEATARAAGAAAEAAAVRVELETRKREGAAAVESLLNAQSAKAAAEARTGEMQKHFEEQQRLLQEAERKLAETFKSVAADILRNSSESFLTLAGERLDSIQKQSVSDLDARHKAIEAVVSPRARIACELGPGIAPNRGRPPRRN